MKRAFMLAALVALAQPALAAYADALPDRVMLSIGSRHGFDIPEGAGARWNEINPGAFLVWDSVVGPAGVAAGAYLNSFGDPSVAVAATLPVASWQAGGTGELSLFAGIAHYPGTGQFFAAELAGDIVPIGGVMIRHGDAYAKLMPGGTGGEPIIAFGLTFPLNPRR